MGVEFKSVAIELPPLGYLEQDFEWEAIKRLKL